ncbi:hypothetical protein SSS_05168 [Sarcoptes scabiei]|uniref:Reverse transcriptase/retrotransposon-derived protein RNase H-like domain-containing protein n=1 Tax=Sarcoptes scabiei TaxID=52283 RepID=A0A834VGJ4_SARSC|nr:hypothetical protein SSS_05168 [Sarcoptes scabiei]
MEAFLLCIEKKKISIQSDRDAEPVPFSTIDELKWQRRSLRHQITFSVNKLTNLLGKHDNDCKFLENLEQSLVQLKESFLMFQVNIENWNLQNPSQKDQDLENDFKYYEKLQNAIIELKGYNQQNRFSYQEMPNLLSPSHSPTVNNQSVFNDIAVPNNNFQNHPFTDFITWDDIRSIPTFDGKREDFEDFILQFDMMVHNKNIPIDRKWQALRDRLRGNVRNAIIGRHHKTYIEVYNKLVKQYRNPLSIQVNATETLRKLPPLSNDYRIDQLENYIYTIARLHDALSLNKDQNYVFLQGRFLDMVFHILPKDLVKQLFFYSNGRPNADNLVDILESKLEILKELHQIDLQNDIQSSDKSPSISNVPPRNLSTLRSTRPIRNLQCVFCSENHKPNECFKTNRTQKIEIIQKQKRCMNCLKPNHSAKACNNVSRCQKCYAKHHTAICDSPLPPNATANEPKEDQTIMVIRENNSKKSDNKEIEIGMKAFLNETPVSIFYDTGASINVIDKKICEALHISIQPSSIQLRQIDYENPVQVQGSIIVKLKIGRKCLPIEFFVINFPNMIAISRYTARDFETSWDSRGFAVQRSIENDEILIPNRSMNLNANLISDTPATTSSNSNYHHVLINDLYFENDNTKEELFNESNDQNILKIETNQASHQKQIKEHVENSTRVFEAFKIENIKSKCVFADETITYPDPDPNKPIQIATKASNEGIGAVLMQNCHEENRTVSYFSKTDHQPIQWLMSQKKSRTRLFNWAMHLSQYDFKIIYRKGSENIQADVLSKFPQNFYCYFDPKISKKQLVGINTLPPGCVFEGNDIIRIKNRLKRYYLTRDVAKKKSLEIHNKTADDFITLVKKIIIDGIPKLIVADKYRAINSGIFRRFLQSMNISINVNYSGPFYIKQKISSNMYQLEGFKDLIHVSALKKCFI